MKLSRLFLFLFSLFAISSLAQSPRWVMLMNDPASNYFDVVKSYEQWKDSMIRIGKGSLVSRIFGKEKLEKIIELKEEGEDHFRHWQFFSKDNYDLQGNPKSSESMNPAFSTERSIQAGNHNAQIQGSWKARGPFDSQASLSGVTGAGKGIGRVFPFGISPTDTNIIFTGGSGVGTWRSIDDGLHWEIISGPGGALRDVKCHPLNPAIWYLLGKGNLYKSLDTGSTWNLIYGSSAVTGSIFVDASQPSTVYLTLNNLGLYKSVDEGATWQFMNTTIPWAIKPGNADVLYSVSGNVFLRSMDSGLTFDSVTTITPPGGLFSMAVTPADTNCIYISYQATSNGGVVVSLDGGNTFTEKPVSTNTNCYFVNPMIAVHPQNKDLLMMGGELLSRSTDGGLTWEFACTYSYDSTSVLPFVHPDHRYVAFTSSGSFWDGNDGGIYKSEDAGVSYSDRTAGLDVSQFLSLDCSPQDTSVFLCGAWDNSILIHKGNNWKNTFAGDGFSVAINPGDPDNFYGKNQYGYWRTFDGGASYDHGNYFVGLNENTYGMHSRFPMRFNPVNSNSLYVAVDNVWKSTDGGDSLHPISAFVNTSAGGFLFISPNDTNTIFTRYARTHNEGLSWTPISKPVYAVDPDEINKIWSVQSNQNYYNIWFSNDTGNTWQEIPSYDVNFNSSTINMECLNDVNDGIFLTIGSMIYYRDNTLSNWQPFNNGFPDAPVTGIKAMPDVGILRVSTNGRGVWESGFFIPGQNLVTDFMQDKTSVCPGDSIHFYDNSLNAGIGFATTYQWSFPGGTPSQSSLAFPAVMYTTPGTYDVILRMSGSNGSDSLTKTATVTVNTPPTLSAPFMEDFEGSVFPPSGWNWNHVHTGSTFGQNRFYSGYQQSNYSTSYGSWVGSSLQQDFFISPVIDLSGVPDPVLQYDRLYAYDYIPAEADTFKLFYSYDCGVTKHYFFSRGGLDLKTDSVYTTYSSSFDSTSWTTDTISLYSIATQAPFQIGFEINSIGRCEFFLDNIQILSMPGVRVPELNSSTDELEVFPNPVLSDFSVLWKSSGKREGVLTLHAVTGECVLRKSILPNTSIPLSASELSAGIYLLRISDGTQSVSRKIIK